MSEKLIQVADHFWNFRGSFRIGGLIDVGTQASLVKLSGGGFVFLDSYSFSKSESEQIDRLTDSGRKIRAILNLHPFHTVHVEAMHKAYPEAELVGTARHKSRFPDLPWSELNTEDTAMQKRYVGDLVFSVPRGVDFISSNENVHFSSVLAFHADSGTIHSDDTFNYIGLPSLLRSAGLGDTVSFHPTLGKALQKRPGAAQDFRGWATGLIEQWRSAENLCAAHTATFLERRNQATSLHERLNLALEKVQKTLNAHERRYG